MLSKGRDGKEWMRRMPPSSSRWIREGRFIGNFFFLKFFTLFIMLRTASKVTSKPHFGFFFSPAFDQPCNIPTYLLNCDINQCQGQGVRTCSLISKTCQQKLPQKIIESSESGTDGYEPVNGTITQSLLAYNKKIFFLSCFHSVKTSLG